MSKRVLSIFILITSISAQQVVTIRDIQYTTDPTGDSPLVGQTVTFTGIVTATASQYPPFDNGFLVQDSSGPWHGIYVYLRPPLTLNVSVGDSVRVTGEVSEYYGLTEVTATSENDVTILASGRQIPAPVSVTTSEIADTSSTEPYECVLVEVRNAVVTNDNLGYGEWEVDDGTGPAVVDDAYHYTYSPSVNDTLIVLRGIVAYAYGEYKLEPRNDNDIISSIDGTGIAWLNPSVVPTSSTIPEIQLGLTGVMSDYAITRVVFLVPVMLSFDTFRLSGAFENAEIQRIGPQITLTNISVTEGDTGYIEFVNLVTPNTPDTYSIQVMTAGEGGTPQPISQLPQLQVLPVSGTGTASINPFMLASSDTVDMEISFEGEFGTVQAVEILLPLDLINWDGELTLDGSFSGASYDVRGDTILIYGIALSIGDRGNITLHSVTPYSGFYDSSRVMVLSGTDTTNLAPISSSPLLVVESTDSTEPFLMLGKLQSPGADGYSSSYEGQFVNIIGVVTGPPSSFSSSGKLSMYIQDISGGVNIYAPSWNSGTFKLGQLVSFYGRVTEYNGLTEVVLEGPNFTVYGDGYAFDTIRLRPSEPLSEKHEGRLIEITGEVASNPREAGAGQSFTVWNGFTPITVYVYTTTGVDLSNIEPGKLVKIVGIGGQYDRDEPYDAGYQLLVRFQDDIQLIGNGRETSEASMNISPNVFAPSLGEVANIEVNGPYDARYTLRVYDARGRVVKEIYAGKPSPANAVWRGDDQFGAPVNIGLYFVRLEVQYTDGKRDILTRTIAVGDQF